MSIKITNGSKSFTIDDPTLNFIRLVNNIRDRFGPIPRLEQRITYGDRNNIAHISNDATLEQAKKAYPKGLTISIED